MGVTEPAGSRPQPPEVLDRGHPGCCPSLPARPRRRGGAAFAALAAATITGAGSLATVASVVAAPPAAAATGFSSPAEGAAYTEDGVVPLRADVGPLTSGTTLHLRDPAGQDRAVASGGGLAGRSLRYDLRTACPSYPGQAECTGRHPAPDGVWTAYLDGGATGERHFVLAIPPDRPTAPDVAVTGPTTVRLQWPLGPEPDLTGYDIRTAGGQPVLTGLAPADHCSTGDCAVEVDFGAAAAGRHDLTLVAHRACPGCGDDVASAPSGPATVTLRGAPAPTPGAGATPSHPAGGATTGSPVSRRPARTGDLTGAIDRAGLGAAPLAALPPATDVTRIPAPEGSYRALLGYPRAAPTVRPTHRPRPAAAPAPVGEVRPFAGRLRDAVTGLVTGGRLWPALAGALVLAVAAAHVRRLARAGRRPTAARAR